MNTTYEAPVLTELGVLTVDTLAGTGDGGNPIKDADGCLDGYEWDVTDEECRHKNI